MKPFDFLEEQFKWAFAETRPGEALAILATRYSESLFIVPPHEETIRKVLPGGAPTAGVILGDLRRRRDDEFYLMMAESTGPSTTVPPSRETSQLAA
jgi:hypothetical protein